MTRTHNPSEHTAPTRAGRRLYRLTLLGTFTVGFMTLLIWSGIVAFQRPGESLPLAVTESSGQTPRMGERPAPVVLPKESVASYEEVGVEQDKPVTAQAVAPRVEAERPTPSPRHTTPGVKLDRLGKVIMVNGKPWTGEVFDHRPIVPVRVQTMKTTAYSPDERSCGKWADGITASGKSVWMNGGRLVAADRAIPYGTILTVPGYNYGKPVQVWDRGGKIKGNRLDLLYPTHEIARRWGVQNKRVVFWKFVEMD